MAEETIEERLAAAERRAEEAERRAAEAEAKRRSFQSELDKLRGEKSGGDDNPPPEPVSAGPAAAVIATLRAEVQQRELRERVAAQFPHAAPDVFDQAASPEELVVLASRSHEAEVERLAGVRERVRAEAIEAMERAGIDGRISHAPVVDNPAWGAAAELTPERFQALSFAQKMALPEKEYLRLSGSSGEVRSRVTSGFGEAAEAGGFAVDSGA
jgi:hypothetical protein